MSFAPIGDTLKQSMQQKGPLSQQLDAAEVIELATAAFNEIFPEDLAKHAKPLYLKNRTLTVRCASSALAQEIRLNQAQIVEKINEKMGKNEVDRIRYLA